MKQLILLPLCLVSACASACFAIRSVKYWERYEYYEWFRSVFSAPWERNLEKAIKLSSLSMIFLLVSMILLAAAFKKWKNGFFGGTYDSGKTVKRVS